jgi:hypothetical protein
MRWLKLVAAYLIGFVLLTLWHITKATPLDWPEWGLIALMAVPFTLLGEFVNSPLWSRLLSPSSPLTPNGFVAFLWNNPLSKQIEQSTSTETFSLLRLAYAFFVLLICFLLMGVLHYFLQ